MALKKVSKNYALLLREVSSMYNKSNFDPVQLRRKFSKFFKTNYLGNFLGLRFADTGASLQCIHEPLVNGGCYVRVISSKFPNQVFDFHVDSNKSFMQKIIKHNLI